MRMLILGKLLGKIVEQCITGLVRAGYFRSGMALLKRVHSLSRKRRRQRLMTVSSVASGGAALCAPRREIYPARTIRLRSVRRYGSTVCPADVDQREHTVTLPALEITVFRDIGVIGGSEMLFAPSDRLLYDELALGDPDRYGCKAFGIIPAQAFGSHLPACHDGRVLVAHFDTESALIPRAIHLCKDHSANYYHWLFECLPRAIVALEQAEYADWPLLVDAGLPPQSLEALQQLCGEREILRIAHREMRNVAELVFPGVFSFLHDNYGMQVSAEDLVIAPEAVHLLRERFIPKDRAAGGRKLYIARDRAKYRRMLNEAQIQDALRAQGFEIVRPEALSFAQQVELFSGASVIVGPTGAGMANMVFAPAGCKVIVLAGDTRGANYFIFGQLGGILGHALSYVTGAARRPWLLHSDYRINLQQLAEALADDDPAVSAAGDELQ